LHFISSQFQVKTKPVQTPRIRQEIQQSTHQAHICVIPSQKKTIAEQHIIQLEDIFKAAHSDRVMLNEKGRHSLKPNARVSQFAQFNPTQIDDAQIRRQPDKCATRNGEISPLRLKVISHDLNQKKAARSKAPHQARTRLSHIVEHSGLC
jgi:hypothetical protein